MELDARVCKTFVQSYVRLTDVRHFWKRTLESHMNEGEPNQVLLNGFKLL